MSEYAEKREIRRDLVALSLDELRRQWAEVWGKEPHTRIGRAMLVKSLEYRLLEQELGGLDAGHRERLGQLVAAYKRDQNYFNEGKSAIKSGTRLVRNWKGERHSVTVINAGYEYKGRQYSSLSEIASQITGSRWNGWVFFGIKKHNRAGSCA